MFGDFLGDPAGYPNHESKKAVKATYVDASYDSYVCSLRFGHGCLQFLTLPIHSLIFFGWIGRYGHFDGEWLPCGIFCRQAVE